MYSELKIREGLNDASGSKVKDASGSKVDTNGSLTPTELMKEIFTKSNIVIFFWFLAIYLVLSFLVTLFNPNMQASMASRAIDFVILGFLLFSIVMSYYSKTDDEKKNLLDDIYETLRDYLNTSMSVISSRVILVCFLFGNLHDFDSHESRE